MSKTIQHIAYGADGQPFTSDTGAFPIYTASTTITIDTVNGGNFGFKPGIDNQNITLPDAVVGASFKFTYLADDGAHNIRFTPAQGDAIVHADLSSAADAVVELTKATAEKGNFIALTCYVAGEWIAELTGTWANV